MAVASADVLALLDGDALVRVYRVFLRVFTAQDGRGLTLHEFVAAVIENTVAHADLEAAADAAEAAAAASDGPASPAPPQRDMMQLVRSLIEIFKNVDVNGDAEMSWSEFTSFLVEAGQAATSARAHRSAFTLVHDARFVDRLSKGTSVVEMRYHPEIDAIVVLEGDSRIVRIYTPLMRLARTIDTGYAVRRTRRDQDLSTLVTHAVARLREGPGGAQPKGAFPRMICVLLSNHTIGVWGLTETECPFHGVLPRVSIEHAPSAIHWSAASQLLIVGMTNGRLFGYDLVHKRVLLNLGSAGGHDDVVLSICSGTPKTDAIYTAGLDGRVLLWESVDPTASSNGGKPRVKRALRAGTGNCVRKLLFVEPLALLLGMTAKSLVLGWDADATEPSIRIEGAASAGGGAAVGPRFVDMSLCRTRPQPRLVTLDEAAVLRVWEIGNAGMGSCPCAVVIDVSGPFGGMPPTCVAVTAPPVARAPNWRDAVQPPPLRPLERLMAEAEAARNAAKGLEREEVSEHAIGLAGDVIVSSGRVFRYSTVAAERPEPPVAVLYNPVMSRFVSAVASDITLWDTDTGKAAEFFPEASASDATCIAFDDRQRKLFVGTHQGEVVALNLSNGSPMKSGHPHSGPVSALCYAEKDRCLVSASWDGSLVVFDDEPEEELDSMRCVSSAHQVDITALALAPELSLVITGDRDGIVKCWDFQDLRLLAVFREHFTVVTAIAAFSSWPFFVSADVDGQVIVCSTRSGGCGGHASKPFQRLYSFRNAVLFQELADPEAAAEAAAATAASAAAAAAGRSPLRAPRRAAAKQPEPIDEKAMLALIESKSRLGALIEQILEDRALLKNPSVVMSGQKRRRAVTLFNSRRDEDRGAPDAPTPALSAAARVRARLRMVDKSLDMAVTSLDGRMLPGPGDGAEGAALLLLMGDDSGRVRLFDLSGLAWRLGLRPVPLQRQPQQLASYLPRRRLMREEAGSVVDDDFGLRRSDRAAQASASASSSPSLSPFPSFLLPAAEVEGTAAHGPAHAPAEPISEQRPSAAPAAPAPHSHAVAHALGLSKGAASAHKKRAANPGERRGSVADLAPRMGDVLQVRDWPAHVGAVTSVSLFVAPHVLQAAQEAAQAAPAPAQVLEAQEAQETTQHAPAPGPARRDPLVGLFAVSCGADCRLFVLDCAHDRVCGQLGRTVADEDAIALGTAQPRAWAFPCCGPVLELAAREEASAVLGEMAVAAAAAGAGAGAAGAEAVSSSSSASSSSSSSSSRALGGGLSSASVLTELSSGFLHDSSTFSLASASHPHPQAQAHAHPHPASSPPRPGHTEGERRAAAEALQPTPARMQREVRLIETLGKRRALRAMRRARERGLDLDLADLSALGGGSAAGDGDDGYASNSGGSESGGDGSDGDGGDGDGAGGDGGDGGGAEEEAAGAMLEPEDIARMAMDDRAALANTGPAAGGAPPPALPLALRAGPAPSPGVDLAAILSAGSPASAAAARLGPAAVSVLALSGFDASGLQASRAVRRTVSAVRALGRLVEGSGRVADELEAAPSFAASATAASFGLPTHVALLDSRAAMALARAMGGVTPAVPPTLKKIAAAYGNLRSEAAKGDRRQGAPAVSPMAAPRAAVPAQASPASFAASSLLSFSSARSAVAFGEASGPTPASPAPASLASAAAASVAATLRSMSSSSSSSPAHAHTHVHATVLPRHMSRELAAGGATAAYAGNTMQHKVEHRHLLQSQPTLPHERQGPSVGPGAGVRAAAALPQPRPALPSLLLDRIMLSLPTHAHALRPGVGNDADGRPLAPTIRSDGGGGGGGGHDAVALLALQHSTLPFTRRLELDSVSQMLAGPPTVRGAGSARSALTGTQVGAGLEELRPGTEKQRQGLTILQDMQLSARDPARAERDRVAIGRTLTAAEVDGDEDSGGSSDDGKGGGNERKRAEKALASTHMPARFGPYSALEVMRARRVFDSADADGSGDVELDELLNSPDWRAAYSLDQIRNMFDAMDTDSSGRITIQELFKVAFPNANARARKLMLKWTDPRRTAKVVLEAAPKRIVNARTRLEAEEVFAALDTDRDGFISLDECQRMFESNGGKEEGGLWGMGEISKILAGYAIEGEPVGLRLGKARARPPLGGRGMPVLDKGAFLRMAADNFFDIPASSR